METGKRGVGRADTQISLVASLGWEEGASSSMLETINQEKCGENDDTEKRKNPSWES